MKFNSRYTNAGLLRRVEANEARRSTRRTLLIALGMGALAAPLRGLAQQKGKVWRIGFLRESEEMRYVQYFDAFKAGLRDLGYAEGRDYTIEQRSAQNDHARLPALAVELLALKVDIILSPGTSPALAARNATRETPILIVTAGNPVGSGLAATLSRPGGNVTGLTSLATELVSKRLDLLRQILPDMRRVGFLYNPDNASEALNLKQFESACTRLQFKPLRAPVRKAGEIQTAFKALQHDKAQGLIVGAASPTFSSREIIIDEAATHRLPAIYPQSLFAESGGLISYAANNVDLYRRAAAYADKIFKGAKPGDLPIEQPTTFDLVINLKTAKAIGLTIPQELLVRADEVIR